MQSLSKSRSIETLGNCCPLFLQVFGTIAPLEVSAWGDTRHENGAEMVSLEPETPWNGFMAGNCQLGTGHFLNDTNYPAGQYLTNVEAI